MSKAKPNGGGFYYVAARRKVKAIEVAYEVMGIRQDGKKFILDHIPTGMEIGRFATLADAHQAVRELIQISDFRWSRPPASIRVAVKEVLSGLAAPRTPSTTLAAAIAKKRGSRPLREVASELGEPHSTIQFVEQGRIPRPALFIKLLAWLEVIDQPTAAKLSIYAEDPTDKNSVAKIDNAPMLFK
jgi:hypothetical protein